MEKDFLTFDGNQILILLFFSLLAFLVGILLGYFLRQRRVGQMRHVLEERESALEIATKTMSGLQSQLDLTNADLSKAIFETGEFKARATRQEDEFKRKNMEFVALQQENAMLKSANETYVSNIEDLNHQILGLKVKVSSNHPSEPQHEAAPGLSDSIERLEAMVERLGRMEAENAQLKGALAEALESAEVLRAALPDSGPTLTFDLPEANEPILLFKREAVVEQTPITLTGMTEPADDLTQIEGIGPFIARLLQQQGINSFAQISQWTEADIEQVTKAIGYFPGRITRDNWVGQAKILCERAS
jgi:predicted flap endonuclease-1-like 5' DNA nuclease